MSAYDLLVVGAGLYGSVVAREAADTGKRVLVVDRRDHIGGNCWSYREEGIDVHAYGPHVIHTDKKCIWNWLGRFADLVPCVVSPIALWRGQAYNLPFNMNTFHQLWGVVTPAEAKAEIERQRVPCDNPRNLEEHVLDMVGRDVYERLVKGYTEKQYGKPCSQLPASLITRMPLRFTYCNDYLGRRYQGVPADGYGSMFDKMLAGIEVRLGVDYLESRGALFGMASEVVFTGPIDEYFGYVLGALEWRGRKFVHRVMSEENHQGCVILNYQDRDVSQLRSIEHKHFASQSSPKTVVTDEFAMAWQPGDEPYYTVNDGPNQRRYAAYVRLAESEPKVHFGGRLGEYRYYTMEDTIQSAWSLCRKVGIH